MPNVGVTGRVVDEGNNPLVGLRVVAYDVEVLFDDVLLGSATTSATGNFSVSYPAGSYGLEANPDIQLRVFDPVQRLLYQSEVYEDQSSSVLNISPEIVINRADADGWLVTGLRRPVGGTSGLQGTGTPQGFSTGNTVTILIDSQKALRSLTQDFQNASGGSIRFLFHYHEFGAITKFNAPYDTNASVAVPSTFLNTPATGAKLEEALLDANRTRGVAVWMVVNDFPLPSPFDAADILEDYLKENVPNTIQFQRFEVPQPTPMHAKVVVLNNPSITPPIKRVYLAIAGGSQEYFDGTDHYIDDPRRGDLGYDLLGFESLNLSGHVIKVPLHDVYGYIEGPAVNHADEAVRLHWNHLSPNDIIPPLPAAPSPSPATADAIQIARTLPKNRFTNVPGFTDLPEGDTGILEGYQRAFRLAADFIYVENQYFTEQVMADLLLAALEQNTSLVAIILINIDVDVPWYDGWQRQLINGLLKAAQDHGAGNRIGVFSLWTHERLQESPGVFRHRIIRNYVHSKVSIVDDKWATFGSANFEGTGLHQAQHLGHLGKTLGVSRGTEVNAFIYNGVPANPRAGQPPGPDLPSSQTPAQLRRRLWAEHLGYKNLTGANAGPLDPDGFNSNHQDLITKPTAPQNPNAPQGWLKLWTDRANEKLDELKKPAQVQPSPPLEHQARILPWKPETDPEEVLEQLGITRDSNNQRRTDLIVETRVRDFDFATGRWK